MDNRYLYSDVRLTRSAPNKVAVEWLRPHMNILLDNGTIRGAFRALGYMEDDYTKIDYGPGGFEYEGYKAVSSAFDLDIIALSVLIESIVIADKVVFIDRSKRSTTFWTNFVPRKFLDIFTPISLPDEVEGWLVDIGMKALENMKRSKNLDDCFQKVVTVHTGTYLGKSAQYYGRLYGLMDLKFEYIFSTFYTDIGIGERNQRIEKSLESGYNSMPAFPTPDIPIKETLKFFDSHYRAFKVFCWLILQTLMYWVTAAEHSMIYSPHPARSSVLDSADDLYEIFRPRTNLNAIIHGKITEFLGEITSSTPEIIKHFNLISRIPPISHYVYKNCKNRGDIFEMAERTKNTRSVRQYKRILSRILRGGLSQTDFRWIIKGVDKVLKNLKEEWGLGEGLSIQITKMPISLPPIPIPARMAFKQFHPFRSYLSLIRDATEYMSNELLFANTTDALFLSAKRLLLAKLRSIGVKDKSKE